MTYGRPLLGLMCALVLMAIGCGGAPEDPVAAAETAPVGSMIPAIAEAQAELQTLGFDQVTLQPVPADASPEARRVASSGPAAKRIADSAVRVDRSTPSALLTDALAALSRRDVAALARLSRAEGQLTEDDAADAARRFLSPAGARYWGRVSDAVRAGRMRVVEDDAGAVITVEVGGAAGVYRVRMRREVDGWYLAS